ncbi:class F sortase [uncultured Streptomyces sp.]|uniref:class F sortase n=1 Tax=uncultured Streptomyces sp. TaxID=174707 RepID=UPI002622EBD0|nr:class F sortase [uncultured Streptomyces sp.]
MTALSRRAFGAAALTSLLAGCGGPDADPAPRARPDGPDAGPAHGAPSAPDAARAPASGGPTGSARTGAAPAPVRLLVPAIGVDTAVMRLGLAPDGTVEVPPMEAHDVAGWYRHSPAPGRTGPSVLLGHATVGSYGDGVFRHLARLHRGDHVDVRLEGGASVVFAVTSVRTVAKTGFPTDDVYGNVDRPELRLITCGGPRTGQGYRDNVIVFAGLGPGAR